MGIVGKSLRVVALLFLLLVGWIVIASLHFFIISYKVPVQPFGSGRVTTELWDRGIVRLTALGRWMARSTPTQLICPTSCALNKTATAIPVRPVSSTTIIYLLTSNFTK